MVALPYQIKELTGSYLAVGAIGAVELIPLIIFGLYGGVLADRYDRKKLIWFSEASAMVLVGGLLLNSLTDSPSLIFIYIITALFSAVDGIQRPSAGAILPRLVSHEDLPAANALMSLRWQLGVIVGPAVGGLVIASFSTSLGFAIDALTYLVSLIFLWKLKNVPVTEKSEKPAISALIEGVRYAFSRKDLLGTYLIDLAAMFFAMPNALFPFWADHLDAKWSLGLFYAAGTVGSVIITLTSGWSSNYRWHGKAVIWAAIGWGVAIAISGVVHSVWAVLFFLAAAGASDMVSALEAARRREHSKKSMIAAALDKLTSREREIMRCVIAGKMNKTMADELGISVKTVEAHRARVMQKLGVESLAALVQLALDYERPRARTDGA